MTPLVSVIVPIYNVQDYLCRCIDSILAQTYKNLEIVLIDDGSTDSCTQICDRYAESDSRIKVIHQKNAGVAAARNLGLDTATGEYLCFVDSDDYVEDCLCERLIGLFADLNVDIITFDYRFIDDKGTLSTPTDKISESQLSSRDALFELLRGNINSYLWNKMYKRKVFEGIRFPVGRLWEDMAVGYRVISNASSVYCLPEKLYYYYMRDGSIIHSIDQKALCDIFYARYSSYCELKDEFPEGADIVFPRVALSALMLYDSSLWEKTDTEEYHNAVRFLADNKDRVIRLKDKPYGLFYNFPLLYRFLRISKHRIGNVVKAIKKKFR